MRQFAKLVYSLSLVLWILTGCQLDRSFVEPTTQLYLGNQQEPFAVYVADTTAERTIGLGNTEQLAEREGMVFLFPSASEQVFWMKDVEYPIDIIWVHQNQVLGFVTAQPEAATTTFNEYQRYASPGVVDIVVELPAGMAEQISLQIGDNILISGVLDDN